MPNGGFIRKEKETIEYRIVIVDEISMVPASLLNILFKHNVYIICCGDNAQLPPIHKSEDNHLLDMPHVFLDEIQRQAKESEIIRLSMDIREGKSISYTRGKEAMILPKKELSYGMLKWSDIILTATNLTRTQINNTIRKTYGYDLDTPPQEGEKIICLKNEWDICSSGGNALVNGTIGYLKNPFETFVKYPRSLGGKRLNLIQGELVTEENETFQNLSFDKKLIMENQYTLDWRESYRIARTKKYANTIPQEFAYGYAVTGWKAQGSSWPHVLTIAENFPYDKEDRKKFLYTCVTRAEEKLVLVL